MEIETEIEREDENIIKYCYKFLFLILINCFKEVMKMKKNGRKLDDIASNMLNIDKIWNKTSIFDFIKAKLKSDKKFKQALNSFVLEGLKISTRILYLNCTFFPQTFGL